MPLDILKTLRADEFSDTPTLTPTKTPYPEDHEELVTQDTSNNYRNYSAEVVAAGWTYVRNIHYEGSRSMMARTMTAMTATTIVVSMTHIQQVEALNKSLVLHPTHEKIFRRKVSTHFSALRESLRRDLPDDIKLRGMKRKVLGVDVSQSLQYICDFLFEQGLPFR